MMKRILMVLAIMNVVTAQADFSFKNTPFDPKTWKKTIKNTPFDPKTWSKTWDELKNFDSVEFCEKQASYFEDTVKSKRTLTHAEKFYLRPWFGDMVDKVVLAQDVNVNDFRGIASFGRDFGAGAKTFGYRVYFGQKIDRSLTWTLGRIAHELFHTYQFEQMGGTIKRFCRAYTDDAIANEGVYDNMSMESAAMEFQLHFLKWLAANHPNPQSIQIQTPPITNAHRRTTIIPKYFRVPDVEYALSSVINETRFNVTFRATWENGPSEQISLAPGASRTFYYEYPGGSRTSPALRISLDVDMSNNQREETYVLERNAHTDRTLANSKQYFIHESYGELQVVDAKRRSLSINTKPLPLGSLWNFTNGLYEKEGDTLWVSYDKEGRNPQRYEELSYINGVVELRDLTTNMIIELTSGEMYVYTGAGRSFLQAGNLIAQLEIGRAWVYDTGRFTKIGDKQWLETDNSGGRVLFEELEFNAQYVRIIDHNRNLIVVLSAENMFFDMPNERMIFFRKGRWQ